MIFYETILFTDAALNFNHFHKWMMCENGRKVSHRLQLRIIERKKMDMFDWSKCGIWYVHKDHQSIVEQVNTVKLSLSMATEHWCCCYCCREKRTRSYLVAMHLPIGTLGKQHQLFGWLTIQQQDAMLCLCREIPISKAKLYQASLQCVVTQSWANEFAYIILNIDRNDSCKKIDSSWFCVWFIQLRNGCEK